MELRQIEHFIAVAGEMSFTRAAERAHVVQSALSTSIAKLERELGVRLGTPGERVMVVGDGRNDIDMLEWAVAGGGVGVAMGQAPEEVRAAANDTTGSDLADGVAAVLARRFQS